MYISRSSALIKYGTMMHIGTPNDSVYQKFKSLQIQDGGRPPS